MNSLSNCATKSRYERIINKTINCIDYGKEVVVDAKANNRFRCDDCIKKARLEKYRKYNEKRKKKA